MAGVDGGVQRMASPAERTSGQRPRIVLMGGDEEYRSEEALPQLAAILSQRHGFETTTLLAVDPATGQVDPECLTNIPGMEALASADLLVLFTRFRELPDEQMRFLDEYLSRGKPVVALRTATHAFNYASLRDGPYAKYSFDSAVPGWEGGFGKRILGESWVSHHGDHGNEGTRGLVDGRAASKDHPIVRGVADIWVSTDVYAVGDLDANVLLWGVSTLGMTPDSPICIGKTVMPVAWTRVYAADNGATGRAFATTMGCSTDLTCEDFRRLLVNACYWVLEMGDRVAPRSDVAIVGEYRPTPFGFRGRRR